MFVVASPLTRPVYMCRDGSHGNLLSYLALYQSVAYYLGPATFDACSTSTRCDPTARFMNALDGFLEENNKCLVGVHCTHGLNRTGYMVCRYMRDRLGVPAAEAIRRFELARGYHIERDNYIADLLGKTPPPPDEGCDTIVKPIKQQENVEKITCKEKEGISHKRKQEQVTISENTKKKKRKRKKYTSDSSSMDKSDRSYDFKYDY
ncbi:Tyrosine-protein phosphatase [Papilio machaon]|uniref:Tyrosine-protein phosphatase n=1 Tax=Papilio machaon TaxID=76193 RepID=A0A194QML3_PAPMA|nr:Tyrosine-protein phosphatase [Papilio machaon]